MSEKKVILKRVFIVFGIAIAIFVIINFVWFFGIKRRYIFLTEKMEKIAQTEEEKEQGINDNGYEKIIDGYRYLVKSVGYLGKSGFACISKEEGLMLEMDEQQNVVSDNGNCVSLYIWPSFWRGYDYGIDISSADENYQINIDSNGEYIEDENIDPDIQDKLKEVLKENENEIDKLFELANNMWGIK